MDKENVKNEILEAIKEMQGETLFMPEIKLCRGTGEFKDLFWWSVPINSKFLKEELKEYTHILFMPYRISFKIIQKLQSAVDKTTTETNENTNTKPTKASILVPVNRWGIKEDYPHIDTRTGNVHLCKRTFLIKECPIKQLILAKKQKNNQFGPMWKAIKGGDVRNIDESNFDVFAREGNFNVNWITHVVIPKECYYPQIYNECSEDISLICLIKGLEDQIMKKGKGVISMTDKVLKKVSEEERIQALRFSREMWELQEAMGRVEAHEEGRIEGKTEGLIEGDRKRQLESARIMKADNMPTDLIKKYTGLSENEIEKL